MRFRNGFESKKQKESSKRTTGKHGARNKSRERKRRKTLLIDHLSRRRYERKGLPLGIEWDASLGDLESTRVNVQGFLSSVAGAEEVLEGIKTEVERSKAVWR